MTTEPTNAALLPLAFLIGEWRTTGTHPMRPGQTLPGHTSFAWHEGGAFLAMHNRVCDPDFPDGTALFGSDDNAGRCALIYFDVRGVSRLFEVTLGEGEVSWRRDNPQLAQQVTIRREGPDGLRSTGRMAQNGGSWGDDLSQVFERIDNP